MERKRLQQQKLKQQQRFCVSQQDLTDALARMKSPRRATYNNLMNVSSSSSALSRSVDTLINPSVSQLIKEFEARSTSTPYVSTQEVIRNNNNNNNTNESETNHFQQGSSRAMKIKVNYVDDNNSSRFNNVSTDQIVKERIHQDQFIGDKEQETIKQDQTLDNDRYKREFPLSSSSSSYYSIEGNISSNTKLMTQYIDNDSNVSKRCEKIFEEILSKEAQLNHALADLISLSNDADISSSVSSSSRSLANNIQHSRTSDATNSITASIALLNNLLETFDFDTEEYRKKVMNEPTNPKKNNDDIQPINMFW